MLSCCTVVYFVSPAAMFCHWCKSAILAPPVEWLMYAVLCTIASSLLQPFFIALHRTKWNEMKSGNDYNWWCHPIVLKLAFLVNPVCKVMTFFSCRLLTTPTFGRRFPVFFLNSATKIKFYSCITPWRVSPVIWGGHPSDAMCVNGHKHTSHNHEIWP